MPKHRSKFARIEPRIAARMTGTESLPFEIKTMNSTISTTEPSVVSMITPNTLGTFLASSWPAKPIRFAAGTIAM